MCEITEKERKSNCTLTLSWTGLLSSVRSARLSFCSTLENRTEKKKTILNLGI
jgi:hypothetical protein